WPWTAAYRQLIVDSRVGPTVALAKAIAASPEPPAVWVNASACGYYGLGPPPGITELSESAPSGGGFLAACCRAWEAATVPARSVTRVVRARTGLVLAPQGMLEQLARLTRLGLAARVGSGRQFWPWISLRDEVRAWEFALTNRTLSGPVNLAGPQLAEAGQVTASLARLEHRPYWLAIPTFAVQAAGLAARELLLGSQPVKPAALESHGFDFQDQTVESALKWALGLT
ncbi:MAG: DUF1731 domain-containing protein, partial [Bifidobacteriaceae bacterium]|nr:DUF1731 domain-containing protein [Bifidobacteriaceae bacterium]